MSLLPRPRRVLAVLRRDLAIEFAGRRGAILPLIASFLLLPLAAAPSPQSGPALIRWHVWGDVPEELARRDDIVVVQGPRRGAVHLDGPDPGGAGVLRVEAPFVPDPIRETLDRLDAKVKTERFLAAPLQWPERSMMLALVASSILTGALSQSLPGERSQRTLEPLLTASITRTELVLGKWLAWGGFGATASLVASLVALALGNQAPGLWLAATPWVSLGMVALGFWLVRRARDVVGGATMAIRMLPATLAFLGMTSWWVGQTHPYLGAAVPIGGALLASGSAWGGAVGPALTAIATTAVTCVVLLGATARDLDPELARSGDVGLIPAVMQAFAAAAVWWLAILGGLAWAIGGSPERTAVISAADGVTAAGLGILGIAAVRFARTPDPWPTTGLVAPPMYAWPVAVLIGLVTRLLTTEPLTPMIHGTFPDIASERLRYALNPGWAGPFAAITVLLGQELLFRGWMRHRAGDLATAILFGLVVAPFDPLSGLVAGVGLGVLARLSGGSVLPGLLARGVCAAIPLRALPPTWNFPASTVAFALVVVGALALWPRDREIEELAAP